MLLEAAPARAAANKRDSAVAPSTPLVRESSKALLLLSLNISLGTYTVSVYINERGKETNQGQGTQTKQTEAHIH